MAYVILPSRKKRPKTFALNYDHPLAQGLAFLSLFNEQAGKPIDIVSLKRADIFGAKWANDGIYHTGDDDCAEWANHAPIVTSDGIGTGDFTVFAMANPVASTIIGHLVTQRSTLTDGIWLRSNAAYNSNTTASSGRVSMSVYNGGYSGVNLLDVVNGEMKLFAGRRLGTEMSLFAGDARSDATVSGGKTTLASAQSFCAGSSPSSTTQIFDGSIQFFGGYNRALSDEEVAILANRNDPMFDGLIRDKKPAPKHWHLGALPDDCKVKTVTPVVIKPTPLVKERGARLNTGHWSTNGLVSAYIMNEQSGMQTADLVTGKRTSHLSGPTTYYQDNSGLMFSESGSLLSANKLVLNPPSNNWTLLVHANLIAGQSSGIYPLVGSGNNKAAFAFRVGAGVYWYCDGYSSIVWSGLNPFGLSVWVLTRRDNNMSLFRDGKLISIKDCSGKTNTWSALDTIGFSWATNPASCKLYSVLGWHRSLNANEAASISANTSQILSPHKRTIYAYNAKHNIVGTQDANTLKWNWGSNTIPANAVYHNGEPVYHDGEVVTYGE